MRAAWVVLLALAATLGCNRGGAAGSGLVTHHAGAPLAGARGVVVLLHGFGAPGNDLVGLAQELARAAPQGTAFVMPEAPHRVGNGGAWFKKPEHVEEIRGALHVLVTNVMKEARVEPGRVVLGGFSQGAMMAAEVALHARRPLGGVIMFSGKQVPGQDWSTLAPRITSTQFLITHGTADNIIPLSAGVAVKTLLEGAGVPVTFVEFNGVHTIAPQARAAAVEFLGSVLR